MVVSFDAVPGNVPVTMTIVSPTDSAEVMQINGTIALARVH